MQEVTVRRWRKERLEAGPKAERPFGPVTVAKAYRLLHAIFETAVEDRIIGRNPCRIAGAAKRNPTSGPSSCCLSFSSSQTPSRCGSAR